MNEVKILSLTLVGLLIAAYLSWTKEDAPIVSDRVTILDIKPAKISGIHLYTTTQTVAVSFRKDSAGERYPWFELQTRGKKRRFAGNDKFEGFLKSFAPFEALRSLGKKLSAEELEQTKLDKPKRKLEIKLGDKTKVYDVGGQPSGSRDHYVKPQGGDEVYLVASKTLSDLKFPEERFMQRKLRKKPLKEVEKVVISADGATKTGLQRNRLSPKDAFWALDSAPDEKNETLGNYIDKLDKLSVVEYPEDTKIIEKATLILDVNWLDDRDKPLGSIKLYREGEGKKANFYAVSPATRVPVKVSRFTGNQLEEDLKVLMSK